MPLARSRNVEGSDVMTRVAGPISCECSPSGEYWPVRKVGDEVGPLNNCVPEAKNGSGKPLKIYTGDIHTHAATNQCRSKFHVCHCQHAVVVNGCVVKYKEVRT
jgi:hypothetical protein